MILARKSLLVALLALGMSVSASSKSAGAAKTTPAPKAAKKSRAETKAPVPEATSSEADAAPKVRVERGTGGKKIYRITEEIRIEGKIQKPEAFFFYQKSSINYDWQELKQDFVPRILESVNQSPF
jgi:hypothetical protein